MDSKSESSNISANLDPKNVSLIIQNYVIK